MCSFEQRVEGGWDPSEKGAKEAKRGGFEQEEASLWGYTLGLSRFYRFDQKQLPKVLSRLLTEEERMAGVTFLKERVRTLARVPWFIGTFEH